MRAVMPVCAIHDTRQYSLFFPNQCALLSIEWVTLSVTSVRKFLAIRVDATPTPSDFSRTRKRLQGRRKVRFEPRHLPHLLRPGVENSP
jgi:hypothetical protein